MIKNIVLLFNILILVFFQNIFDNGVSVTANMPAKADPGTEFTVDVAVNKAQITGFAKLQFQLPEGFTAEVVEGKGASFTFKDQKVKFIWMALPPEQTFNLSFKVKVDAAVTGEKSIVGEFSYLENNEKKILQLEEKKVMTAPEKEAPAPAIAEKVEEKKEEPAPSQPAVAQPAAPVVAAEPAKPAEPVAEAAKTDTAAKQVAETKSPEVKTDAQPVTEQKAPEQAAAATEIKPGVLASPEVVITREFDYSNVSNREITVYIKIKKGSIAGFTMLQETLPSGMTASKGETVGATFANEDQKVKFLWMNIPDQNEINISYNILVDANIGGEYYLNGEFSYLENGATKKKILEQQAIKINAAPAPAPVAATETKKEEVKKEEPAAVASTPAAPVAEAKSKPEAKVKEEPAKPAKKEKTKPASASEQVAVAQPTEKKQKTRAEKTPVTGTPAPVAGINYKVQVAASHFVVGNDYFVKNHNLSASVDMEMHEGWNKYTTGNFPQYQQARDHREVIRESNSVVGPFVAAYNDGNRITVQEALMLSQQKWVK